MKHTYKRLVAMVLAGVMAFSMVGCSEKTASEGTEAGNETTSQANGETTQSSGKNTISIIGATSGGTLYLVANTIAQVLNTHYPERFAAAGQASNGGVAMMRMLQSGEGEFGITMGTTITMGYKGIGAIEEPYDELRAVSYLYDNVIQIVATKSSGITCLADLKGKSMCVGASGSGTYLATLDVLAGTGLDFVDKKDFRAELTNEAQSVELLKNGQVDAAMLYGPIGSASMLDIMTTGDYILFEMTPEEIDATLGLEYGYYEYTIPANTYSGQTEEIHTVAAANTLIANANVSDAIVYDLLTGIYDHLEEVQGAHSAVSTLTLEKALTGINIPLHPGAEAFYKERGIMK